MTKGKLNPVRLIDLRQLIDVSSTWFDTERFEPIVLIGIDEELGDGGRVLDEVVRVWLNKGQLELDLLLLDAGRDSIGQLSNQYDSQGLSGSRVNVDCEGKALVVK